MARVGNSSEVMRTLLLKSTDERRARSEPPEPHSIDVVRSAASIKWRSIPTRQFHVLSRPNAGGRVLTTASHAPMLPSLILLPSSATRFRTALHPHLATNVSVSSGQQRFGGDHRILQPQVPHKSDHGLDSPAHFPVALCRLQ